jgi:hypothetical protein
MTAAMTPEEMDALATRVGNGMQWLADNDPVGAFYAWWQTGLTPATPMPAQDPETMEAWRNWYRQKERYDRLELALSRAESRGYRGLTWPMGWVPEGATRR